MNIKNPYKLINKANSTFNLYLKKYEEYEKFMETYGEDQEKTNKTIQLFLEKYRYEYDQLNNTINKILNLLDAINEENNANKKRINNLEMEIHSLNNNNNSNYENILSSIKNSNNNVANLLNNNEKAITNSINSSNALIKNHVFDVINDLDSSIQTQNKEQNKNINDALINIKSTLKTNTKNINSSMEKQNELTEQNKQIKEFINLQKDTDNKLLQAINLFNLNYNELKRYFYNDCENSLKEYLNTDELFRLCYFNNFQFLSYSPAENRILIKTNDDIILGTNNRFYTIKEVIGFNGYSIPQLYDFDEFVVFDVGMNRAYASLWFAKFDNCQAVYGFEIDDETYGKALSNINLNPKLSSKITMYNFGLSDKDEDVDLYYVNGCDGVNTMLQEVAEIQPELQDENKLNTKKVRVKKASDILSNLIKENNITSNIVLKIDTEGAEYKIIADLIESNVISKVDVILGEGHLFKENQFCDKLIELGFEKIKLNINSITYNFAFVKKEYYNMWHLKE